MKKTSPLLLVAGVTACVMQPRELPDPGPMMPVNDTCGAAPHADLIGQDATALERVMILGQVRVIRPGMAVTRDFRPDRINFIVDESNLIARITCT